MAKINDKKLGKRLREIRKSKALSAAALGELTDLSMKQILKYEKGINSLSAINLYKMSKVLEIPMVDFFNDLN